MNRDCFKEDSTSSDGLEWQITLLYKKNTHFEISNSINSYTGYDMEVKGKIMV